MPSSREPGRFRTIEAFLFPGVGVVAGVLVFVILAVAWPRLPAQRAGGAAQAPAGQSGPARAPQLTPQPAQPSRPSSMQDVRVVGGTGRLMVSWAAPADAEGVSFEVIAVSVDTGRSVGRCVTQRLSCVFRGLTNGAAYTIEVHAKRAGKAVSKPLRTRAIPRPDILTSQSAALWLDGNDVASVTAAAKGAVTQWRDKSGRGNAANQPDAATRPVLRAHAGLHALHFNGAQSLVADGTKLPSGTTQSQVFVAVRMDDPSPAESCFAHVLAWGTGQPLAGRIIHKGCRTALAFAETFDTFASMKPTKQWPKGRMALLSVKFAHRHVEVRMNGVPDYSWTAPAGREMNTRPQPNAMIGGAEWSGLDGRWRGLIGEVIVLSGKITPTDRDQVEQYLIRKWRIS